MKTLISILKNPPKKAKKEWKLDRPDPPRQVLLSHMRLRNDNVKMKSIINKCTWSTSIRNWTDMERGCPPRQLIGQ